VAAETAEAVRAVHERVKEHMNNVSPSAFATYVDTPVGSMQTKLRDASIPFRKEPYLIPTDRARLLSVMARGGSAWNQAIPTVPELTFTNELFQTAVYQMLGQPLPVLENVRQCLCGGDMDVYGNHFASKACRQSLRLGAGPGHGLTARHDAVKNAWMYLARKAGVKVTVEQAALPGLKATRRGDVTFHGLHDGVTPWGT
jgi:hypothetical protein